VLKILGLVELNMQPSCQLVVTHIFMVLNRCNLNQLGHLWLLYWRINEILRWHELLLWLHELLLWLHELLLWQGVELLLWLHLQNSWLLLLKGHLLHLLHLWEALGGNVLHGNKRVLLLVGVLCEIMSSSSLHAAYTDTENAKANEEQNGQGNQNIGTVVVMLIRMKARNIIVSTAPSTNNHRWTCI